MALVCLMTMVMSVNAQNNIRKAALNKFKTTLVAPSQFILTDSYGNRTNINKIPAYWCDKRTETYTVFLDGGPLYDSDMVSKGTAEMAAHKIREDIIKIVEEVDTLCPKIKIITRNYIPVYAVTITGDARNRMGGYEQINSIIYVDKNNVAYLERPYKETETEIYNPKVVVKYTHFYYKEKEIESKYILKFRALKNKFTYGGLIGLEKHIIN